MRIVYIANDEASNSFRSIVKECQNVKLGVFHGAGAPDYLSRLGENVSSAIDAVIVDRDGLVGLYDDDQIIAAMRAYEQQGVLDKADFYIVARGGIDISAVETLPDQVKIVADVADVSKALEPIRARHIDGVVYPHAYATDEIPTQVHKDVYDPFSDADTMNQMLATDDGSNPFADFDISGDPFAVAPMQNDSTANPIPVPSQISGQGSQPYTQPLQYPQFPAQQQSYGYPTPQQPQYQPSSGYEYVPQGGYGYQTPVPPDGTDPYFGVGISEPQQHMNHLPYDEYQELTEGFTGDLSDSDLQRLLSVREPEWDYSLAKEDLHGGKKFKKNAMSQVSEVTLANSAYIHEQEEINGSYMPSDEAKIITVHAVKGGNGKTTVSVMIATQLNWYFNREVLLGRTQSISSRVMILSLNEFDDLSTHDIGEQARNLEETAGRNVLELKQIIEATHGNPQWDDISHCFSVSHRNFIFYLPSMTLKDKFTTGVSITADDYRKIIEVCSRFFNYIVLDCPDMFAEQKEDLMTFAYNVSDIICMVIEADQRSTVNLFNLLKGLESDTNRIPLNPKKCLLVVNKYATGDNPYRGVTPRHDQIAFTRIVKATRKFFSQAVAIPLSEYRSYGNVLNGTDPAVKKAAAELADTILEMIDANEAVENAGKHIRR